MQLTTPLPAVADLERSFRFYRGLFEQEAVLDLGGNLSLSGGFALQQDFDRLAGIPKDSVTRRSNSTELYFETEDFDGFVARLSARKDIDYAHPPRKHPWQQRAVRIYAPDGHLIEVGESMRTIARRFHKEGRPAEEIASLMHSPSLLYPDVLVGIGRSTSSSHVRSPAGWKTAGCARLHTNRHTVPMHVSPLCRHDPCCTTRSSRTDMPARRTIFRSVATAIRPPCTAQSLSDPRAAAHPPGIKRPETHEPPCISGPIYTNRNKTGNDSPESSPPRFKTILIRSDRRHTCPAPHVFLQLRPNGRQPPAKRMRLRPQCPILRSGGCPRRCRRSTAARYGGRISDTVRAARISTAGGRCTGRGGRERKTRHLRISFSFRAQPAANDPRSAASPNDRLYTERLPLDPRHERPISRSHPTERPNSETGFQSRLFGRTRAFEPPVSQGCRSRHSPV